MAEGEDGEGEKNEEAEEDDEEESKGRGTAMINAASAGNKRIVVSSASIAPSFPRF